MPSWLPQAEAEKEENARLRESLTRLCTEKPLPFPRQQQLDPLRAQQPPPPKQPEHPFSV
jgi:hypothetical protein